MSESVTIPAPGAVSPDSAAPAAKAQPAEKPAETTPLAATPAGTDPNTEPNPEKDAATEAEPSEAALRRKERNRERWRAMTQERLSAISRAERAEAALAKIQAQTNRDYSQFEDPTEELAARTADKMMQSQASEYGEQAKVERARADGALADAWNSIREDMRERISDFDEVVSSVPVHKRAVPFIVHSEKGGDIAYWLGKNPRAAENLYRTFEADPAQALIELGRIDARLTAPEPKRISTAPKPASVLSGGSSPMGFDARTASADDMASQLRKAGVIR